MVVITRKTKSRCYMHRCQPDKHGNLQFAVSEYRLINNRIVMWMIE